jgi:hypothetical protein
VYRRYAAVREALLSTLDGGALKIDGAPKNLQSALHKSVPEGTRLRTRNINGECFMWLEKKA